MAALRAVGRPLRADRSVGRPRGAAARRADGARAPDPRRAGDGRVVPAPGLGRQRGDAATTCSATRSPLGRARLHAFLLNKGPWSRLDHNEPFVPGAPAKPRGRQLLPAGRDARRGREVAGGAAAGRKDARHRLLHDDPPRRRRRAHGGALQRRIPGRAGPGGRAPARGRRRPPRATLKAFLESRAAAFSSQRLLRQRREVDGARRRRSSRRSARTRSTRTSGSTPRRPSRPSSP